MPTLRPTRSCLGLLLIALTTGCASAAPFSLPTPGLATLAQEEEYFFATPPEAMEALGATPLRSRVQNLMDSYEDELARARRAQGGFLNTTLSVLGLVLPVAGTASTIALSDPDQIEAVSIATGAATTVTMALSLLLKPQAKAAAARQCASFLETSIASFRRRWETPASIAGTPQEWNTYLTMRATLEPGRVAACTR